MTRFLCLEICASNIHCADIEFLEREGIDIAIDITQFEGDAYSWLGRQEVGPRFNKPGISTSVLEKLSTYRKIPTRYRDISVSRPGSRAVFFGNSRIFPMVENFGLFPLATNYKLDMMGNNGTN